MTGNSDQIDLNFCRHFEFSLARMAKLVEIEPLSLKFAKLVDQAHVLLEHFADRRRTRSCQKEQKKSAQPNVR